MHCNGTRNFLLLNKQSLNKFSKHIDSTQFKSHKLLQNAYAAENLLVTFNSKALDSYLNAEEFNGAKYLQWAHNENYNGINCLSYVERA